MTLFNNPQLRERWSSVLFLMLLMALVQVIGPELFRFEIQSIQSFQLWRFLTGHWVHANWIHYLLNMAGLLLCVALTQVSWRFWQWGWRIWLLSCGISLGFLLWHNNMGWYVGFSGVLFGLYVMSSIQVWSQQPIMSSLILLIIAVKIAMEQWSAVEVTSSKWVGVPVLVDAHWYGVLCALIILMSQFLVNWFQRRGKG